MKNVLKALLLFLTVGVIIIGGVMALASKPKVSHPVVIHNPKPSKTDYQIIIWTDQKTYCDSVEIWDDERHVCDVPFDSLQAAIEKDND